MKKKTKLGLGIASLAVGVLALSGCTSSFCSTTDKAHMLTAYDNGVCKFYNADDTSKPTEECYELVADGVSNIYFTYSFANNNGGLTKTNEAAKSNNITYVKGKPEFWAAFDLVIIEKSIAASGSTDINSVEKLNTLLDEYKHLRFDSSSEDDKLWDNWQTYFDAAVTKMIKCGEEGKYDISYDISKVPSSDYVALYKTTMESAIANYRGCITTKTGFFGNFGWNTDKTEVQIEAKSYQYGWSKGFFEGLLVYPIGALIDVMCSSFASLGNGLNGTNGWAQLLTIVLVTLIVRAFIFAVSFKSTINNARMTELQPQLAKIQAKYPNANTNQNEKARMADEMNKLYKKNHINPFSSILVMIIQFPVFICVWGALIGSGWLSTGQFLGMNFADSISSILFNASNWQTGAAWTALVLFLLMAIAQVVSMLLPQWMQKAKQKKVAKLGKNPAQTQQNRTMKIVTYVMMIMIIFMGFSLASAMGVYWFIGAIISIIQTLVTQAIIARQSKEKK
ncbi:MAG: membrane protein insertase YidC [Bacilli bacterium]|nr:membrane protein insertase YidC [Bacilli bacterium]